MRKQIDLKKEYGLQPSIYSRDGYYDYRDVFMRLPRFCEWRNKKASKTSYKYKTELIDSRGDLLICLAEIDEYLNDDINNIVAVPKL